MAGAPSDTGVLAEAVSEVGPLNQESVGRLSIGVGNQQRLGRPDEDAPEGMIAAFLEDNPEYRSFRMPGFESRLAWWFLPQAGKEALQEARAGGLYGGPEYNAGDPAKYLYVQSQDKGEWMTSAFGAGLEGRGSMFMTEAIEAWRQGLPELIGRYIR